MKSMECERVPLECFVLTGICARRDAVFRARRLRISMSPLSHFVVRILSDSGCFPVFFVCLLVLVGLPFGFAHLSWPSLIEANDGCHVGFGCSVRSACRKVIRCLYTALGAVTHVNVTRLLQNLLYVNVSEDGCSELWICLTMLFRKITSTYLIICVLVIAIVRIRVIAICQ